MIYLISLLNEGIMMLTPVAPEILSVEGSMLNVFNCGVFQCSGKSFKMLGFSDHV